MPRMFALPERLSRQPGPLVLGLLLLGVGWAYWPTFVNLARRWSQDPQYTHGYVVPGFALVVLWFRRDTYPAATVRPTWWGVPVVVGACLLRLLGAAFHYETADAGSLLPVLVGLCLLLGGLPLLRWGWPALTFLLFILPLPYQVDVLLTQPLRHVSTVCSTYALQTLGVPAVAEGNVIALDELKVGVVEACSGLGMLMTFFALSTAVAFVMRRPLAERLVVFASAVPVGVLMNVGRITVTVLLYQFASAEVARMVFHDLAGWVMMPAALVVLWLEMRFLECLWLEADPNGPRPGSAAPARAGAKGPPSQPSPPAFLVTETIPSRDDG